jgi:hypothetical protein
MKNLILLFSISLMLIFGCAKKETVKFPQGAWQLVQTQTITDGKVDEGFPVTWGGSLIKMWTEKNWSNIGKWKQDTLSGDLYAGGTYTLEGNKYEENILYHATKQYEGKISTNMGLELKNDTLILTYHPIDTAGVANNSIDEIEKYVRIK